MRTRLLSIGILFLALFAGGWGSVIAAALCPHMASDHSCCAAARKTTSSARDHESMKDMEGMGEAGAQETSGGASGGDEIGVNSLEAPAGECGHCVSRPETRSTPVSPASVTQRRHNSDCTVLPPARELSPQKSSFAPPVSARQHAPPGSRPTPRHVLIQIFLI